MVDIDTRRIIDLLPSREIGDVAEWLSTFPNLEIVSRDGSVSQCCKTGECKYHTDQ